MKISIVIPSIGRHFRFLWRALDSLSSQTRIPDEVIVSQCESILIPDEKKSALSEKYSKIFEKFELLLETKALRSGPNRQKASDVCTGDFIVYQDADDASHRQRVEILENIFNNNDVVHIAHSYKYMNNYNTDHIDISKIKIYPADKLYKLYFSDKIDADYVPLHDWPYGACPDFNGTAITAGAMAIRREVLKEVRWRAPHELILSNSPTTEDYEFDMEILFKFKKSILIDAPVYFYEVSSDKMRFDPNNFGG